MFTETQAAKPKRLQRIRWLLPPLVMAALLIVAMNKWIQWEPGLLAASRNELFRIRNGTWQRLPELPGEPAKLQVSGRGSVWAQCWRGGAGYELARLEGPSWRVFTSADFGTRDISQPGGFVLDGEEVWAVTTTGLLHFDGRRWECYRALAGGASSLTAAHGNAWVIDDDGDLGHFDGNRWTVRKVELPGVKWDANEDADSPELALTDDGSLWIVRDGLWRLDGAQWVAVRHDGNEFKDAWLAGSGGKGIWVWDAKYLRSVGPGGTLEEFDPKEMGLLPGESIYEVVGTGSHIYVATSRGILEVDGAKWRRLIPLPTGVQEVPGVRLGSGGDLFALATIENPAARRWRPLVLAVPFALVLGMLAVPVWMVRRYKRNRLSEHQRLQQAVAHATGAVPEEFAQDERVLKRQSSWWAATAAVGVVVGAMVAYSITRRFWPAVPAWMFLAIALALHMAVMLGQTLVRRAPKPWDPIEPGGVRFDWAPTRRAVPAAIAVFVLMNFGAVQKWMGDPVLWLLGGSVAVIWYRTFATKFLNSASRRGDYDGALKIVRRIYFYNPDGGQASLVRGFVLLLAGRFGEAEEALRRAVATLRSRAAQAHALEHLGDALLEQGRYNEAQRSYEAALHALPGCRRPYRGMAELMLRQGHDPVRALECVENIVGPSGPSRNRWTVNGNSTDDYWALKAWALAELGHGAEAAQAVAQAIRSTNRKSQTDLAATCRRLGLAMRAAGRPAEAEDYLKQARDADPHGRWSALARAALGEKSVWRV